MKDLKKLRQARIAKAQNGKTKLAALNALLEKAELTEAETAQLAALEAEIDVLEGEVNALDVEIAAEEKKAKLATLFTTTAGLIPARSIQVNDLNPETTGGFRNVADFAISVRSALTGGGFDPRLGAAPANFQQNQGGAGEGFLTPTDYRDQIWALAFPDNDLLSLCNPEPTNSNAISLPKDETTPWGAAGVQAGWRIEAGQMSATKAAITGAMMQLHELYAFVIATDELMSDAPRLNARLTVQSGRAINWKASDGVMWGDGNGKPLGFMNSKALVTVAKDAGQAAKTLSVNNIASQLARLLATGGNPVWIANRDILPQLIALVIGNQPAWVPFNQGLVGGPGGYLLGYPVYFNEHAQTLGTLGDLVLADLTGYALASKIGQGIEFASSIHLFFDYNMSAFRWTFRLGGQPYLSAPVAPANGANTKSHFVALAAR
jgi:HK97 family phage major capsid protein